MQICQRKKSEVVWTRAISLFLCLIAATEYASASSSSSRQLSVVANVDIQRALEVKNLLARRLDYVESGKRRNDFSKWVQEQGGGNPIVFSTHGVEPNAKEWKQETAPKQDESDDVSIATVGKEKPKQQLSRKRDGSDPFHPDRLNLDITIATDTQPLIAPLTPNVLQLSLRAIVLALRFGPVLSTLGVALLSSNFRNNFWYAWLTHCMAACGPAWIKWGQWSSTRNDMFPEAFCEALSRLHADAPAHSWQISRETLESSLQIAPHTLDTVFDDIETTPIASGSIAQIHRAILNGQLVAVKIRHPRVQQLMELDFRLMGVAARAVDWIIVKFTGIGSQIQESVKQFSHTMAAQSYLQVEAHHLELLNDNFKSWPQVRFPFPFFASDAVIIETYEPGRIVTSMIETYQHEAEDVRAVGIVDSGDGAEGATAATPLQLTGGDDTSVDKTAEANDLLVGDTTVVVIGDDQESRRLEAYDMIPLDVAEFLVTNGLGLYLKMLLVDGLMHADLHPGNIMVDLSRTRQRQHLQYNDTTVASTDINNSPKTRDSFLGITLVDAGMVAQLTERESSNFIGLLASIGEGNGRDAANFALQFSLENGMDAAEREAFCQDMYELFLERCQGYHSNIDVGFVLRGVLGLIRKHQVRIDANYATLVVNALCVESLARNVCPSYNLLDAAKPLLRTYRRLCYNKDGSLKPNTTKSRRVKVWMGLMYQVKKIQDNMFFRKEAKRRKCETRRRVKR